MNFYCIFSARVSGRWAPRVSRAARWKWGFVPGTGDRNCRQIWTGRSARRRSAQRAVSPAAPAERFKFLRSRRAY